MGLGLLWCWVNYSRLKGDHMTADEPKSLGDEKSASQVNDGAADLWQKYQCKKNKNSRIVALGFTVFGVVLLVLLGVGLWIVAVR